MDVVVPDLDRPADHAGAPAPAARQRPPSPAVPCTTFDGRIACAHGWGGVRRSGGPAALARLIGLPPDGTVTAELTVEPSAAGDRWTRRFGRRRWATTCTRTSTGMVEWLGPGQRHHLLGVDLAVTVDEDGERSTVRLRTVRLGPLRLGRPLGLRIDADLVSRPTGLSFGTTVSVAGRVLVGYQGVVR